MSEFVSQTMYEREPAKRVFAAELREASRTIRDTGDEKSPTYLLLPTGERCNRILIAGAITDKSKAGDQNVQYRAKVSDPTGMFYISASSYQPEAMLQLAKIDTDMPSFVVVVGKPNTYTTPEGRVLVSVRAEAVQVVDRETRDLWILDTARATLDRVDVMFGAEGAVSADAALAKETYPQKAEHWKKIVFDALSKLV
ncbi:nucleic acid-binding protein [Methanocorpusculum sp.]|nr:nucleic acid-binding protein [Methanocorpusculum sp.]